MGQILLKIAAADGSIRKEAKEQEEVYLVYENLYQKGDTIQLEPEEVPAYYWVQLDDARESSLVYLTGNVSYQIPFDEARKNISPKAFTGSRHLLCVKKAKEFEPKGYRNLSVNIWDQHHIISMYPHAWANVETRGESVFAAQNAIDGNTLNLSHGEWPYESWGINMQSDAKIRIDFGRTVETDCIILYTRADFPHDNWWTQVSLQFSDGSSIKWNLEKSTKPHKLTFPTKKISWLEMHDMIKSDDPSPFPALTQIEVYGQG